MSMEARTAGRQGGRQAAEGRQAGSRGRQAHDECEIGWGLCSKFMQQYAGRSLTVSQALADGMQHSIKWHIATAAPQCNNPEPQMQHPPLSSSTQ
jgi:hypothetical protein